MRGGTARVIVFTFIAFFVGDWAAAAGPQFTGLLNIYSPSSSGFNKSSNSLAVMDKDGPVDGTAVRLQNNWSDIVVPPDGHAWFTLTHHEVYKINPITGAATQLVINVTLPPGEDTSWTVGEAWDSTRNRLVVATLAGTGFMFGYFDTTNQWNVISNLNNVDLRAIAYRPSNDTIYAIPNDPRPNTTQLFKYNANGQQIGTLNLSQVLSNLNSGDDLEWQMTFASDGQIAVLKPAFIPGPGGGTVAGNWLYLINPDSGAVTYSAPMPVPEPGMMGLLVISGILLSRRPHLYAGIRSN